nr:glycine-rich protein [Tanacetum cinerariifolium]
MLFAVIGLLEHLISSLFVVGSLTTNEGSSREGTASNPYDFYNLDGDGSGGGSGGMILLFVNTLSFVIGSLEHPISSLFVVGSLTANEGSSGEGTASNPYEFYNLDGDGSGGGSGGTILLFVNTLSFGTLFLGSIQKANSCGSPSASFLLELILYPPPLRSKAATARMSPSVGLNGMGAIRQNSSFYCCKSNCKQKNFFKDVGIVVEVRFTIREDIFARYGHANFSPPEAAQECES